MPNYSMPTNPVGTYNPCWMYYDGYNWGTAWNTAIKGSPEQTGADVLSNCVGYCEGRMLQIYMEITSYDPDNTGTHPFVTFGYHNAGEWLQEATDLGFDILDHPEEGCILVTDSHVAVIERDDPSGWLISESGYGDPTPWYLQYSLYEYGGTWYSSYASDPTVIGFFRIPGTTPGGHIMEYDRHRSRRYRIDGY